MYFPSSSILSELKNNLVPLLHNYGSRQSILNKKLATYLLCQEDKVTVLNGASQIYPILEKYLTGKKVLIPNPSFGEYARIFPDHLSYSDQVGFDTQEIEEKIQDCDIIVIVNPNNPTGSLLLTDWIYNLAVQYPKTLVLVDESFISFSNQKSILSWLEKKPLSNIILITSLSKTLGLPGIRLGYIYCDNSELNTYVCSQIPIWNLNSVAEYFLEIILKHRDEVKASFRRTIEDREKFSYQLQSLPIVNKVYPSGGNFLLVSLTCDTKRKNSLIEHFLSKYRIYVKDVSSRFTDKKSYLRLAVRNLEDNQNFISCFRSIAFSLET